MNSAYCEHCNKTVHYSVKSSNDSITVRESTFNVDQDHAFCAVCGAEIYPSAIDDKNIERAHNAYRESIGSITTTRIQELLDMYNAGAEPMSVLLGWGKNTLSRQLKYSIPSSEHSKLLESLFNHRKMRALLNQNRARITPVAARKIQKRLDEFDAEHAVYSVASDDRSICRLRRDNRIADSSAKVVVTCSVKAGEDRQACARNWRPSDIDYDSLAIA